MNSWLAWAAFLLVALVLGLVGYHFSLRALRIVTAITAMASAVYITWYGLTHPAKAAGGLSGAFARGADALSIALFRAVPGSGRMDRHRRPARDRLPATRSLGPAQPGPQPGYLGASRRTPAGRGSRLPTSAGPAAPRPARRRTQVPAARGASARRRPSCPAAAGPAAWRPSPRRAGSPSAAWPGPSSTSSGCCGRARAGSGSRSGWSEPPIARARSTPLRVTVDLDDPRTGLSIATKTLTACCIDHAASVVAGYVARYIFAEDRTAPPWCTGAADGRDLAALLIARQVRDYPESQDRGRRRHGTSRSSSWRAWRAAPSAPE